MLAMVLVLFTGVLLSLTLLRFAPNTLLPMVNTLVLRTTGYGVEVRDLEVRLWPLRVSVQELAVNPPGSAVEQLLTLQSGQLSIEPWRALTGKYPFWSLQASAADLYLSPSDSTVPLDNDPVVPTSPLDLASYLSFSEIELDGVRLFDARGEVLALKISAERVSASDYRAIVSVTQNDAVLQVDALLNVTPHRVGLVIDELDLTDILASPPSQTVTGVALPKLVEAEMDWVWLQQFTGYEFVVDVGRVTTPTGVLTGLATKIEFGSKAVHISPFSGRWTSRHSPLDETFNLTAHLAPLAPRTTHADLTGQLKLQLPGRSIEGEGQWNINALRGTEVGLKVAVEQLGSFASFTDRDLNVLLPIRLSSAVQLDGFEVNASAIEVNYAQSDLRGELLIGGFSPEAPALKVRGELTAERLQLPKLGSAASATDVVVDEQSAQALEPTPNDPAPKLFSSEAIDWGWLALLDVGVRVSAKELQLLDAHFTNFELSVDGQPGTLSVSPFTAEFGGGGFNGKLTVTDAPATLESVDGQLAPTAVALDAHFEMQDVDLEAFGLISKEALAGGLTHINLDLQAQGDSSATLASSVNGELLMTVTDAVVQNDTFELVGSDLVMETLNKLNPFRRSDPTTELECALVRFSAKDGVLQSNNQLIVETTKMEIIGGGKIDLGKETLDIGVSPSAKGGVGVNVGSVVKFLQVGGPLSRPRAQVDALGAAKSGAAIGAAVSTGGLSIVAEGLLKRVQNSVNACEQALSGAKEELPPVQATLQPGDNVGH